jgi:hypothetical protein
MKKPYPQPPSDAPPGTVWFGGPIPWFLVSLSIKADDLDPDGVTRLLGTKPDDVQRRGVATANGRRAPFGMWTIRLRRDETTEWDVGVAIAMLLDRVSVSTEAWDQARASADARVSVGLHLDSSNRGFELAPDLLRRLANLGLRLDVDIYAGNADTTHD